MNRIMLDGENLTLADVVTVARAPEEGEAVNVEISEGGWQKVRRAEKAIGDLLARGEIVYGVTTGFGAFKDRLIPPDQVTQLQHNILMSHAVGVGPVLDIAVTRAIPRSRADVIGDRRADRPIIRTPRTAG